MLRKTYGAEEIVGILRDIEILNGKRKSIADCCRDKGISEVIKSSGFLYKIVVW